MKKEKKIKSIFKKYLGKNVDIDNLLKENELAIESDYMFVFITVFDNNIVRINETVGEFIYYLHKSGFNSWIMGNSVLFACLYNKDQEKLVEDMKNIFTEKKHSTCINIFYGISKGIKYNIKYNDIFIPNILINKINTIYDLLKKDENIIMQV